MVLLMVITVGYLPLVLPWLLPGASVGPGQIAGSLVVTRSWCRWQPGF